MFCLFLAANVERKNKIPNKMLLFFEKSIVFCHLYPSGGDFRKRRNVLFHTSKCFLLKAETFFKKPVAFWLLSGDLCGRGWEKAVWRSFWKGADDAAESCGRWSRIVRSLEPDCAVVFFALTSQCEGIVRSLQRPCLLHAGRGCRHGADGVFLNVFLCLFAEFFVEFNHCFNSFAEDVE